MDRLIAYLIAKLLELTIFTALVALYYNAIYPTDEIDWIREILSSFYLVFTFFIVSVYIATSLVAHLAFQERRGFGFFCAGAYVISALFFFALNPVTGLENLVIFVIPLPLTYVIGNLAKRLTIQLRKRAAKWTKQ